MTKEDNYDILYDRTIVKLKARVEDKKLKGWRCIGGIEIGHTKEDGKLINTFYQAMEKKEGVL